MPQTSTLAVSLHVDQTGILGAGRPLFGRLPADLELEHLSTRAFDFGFVQSTYRVARSRT